MTPVIDHELRRTGVGVLCTRNCKRCGVAFAVYEDYPKQKYCTSTCANRRQGDAGMQNRVECRGDVSVVFIERKGCVLECLIDTEDLARVTAVGRTWHARWQKDSQTYYATCHKPGVRGSSIQMHRIIMGVADDVEVDHVHHNGLDNRKKELLAATPCMNQFNRRRVRPGAASSQRGVNWDARKNRWIVKFTVNGVKKQMASFLVRGEAEAFAAEVLRVIGTPSAVEFARIASMLIPYPSERKIAGKVAKRLCVTPEHVCDIRKRGSGSRRVLTELSVETERLECARCEWWGMMTGILDGRMGA